MCQLPGEKGETITMETLSLPRRPLPPHPLPITPILGREDPAEVKRVLEAERRWQLSLQSWRDKVISPFMLQLVSAGVKLLCFFKSPQRGGLSQRGLNPHPMLSFSTQLIYFTDKLLVGLPLLAISIPQTAAMFYTESSEKHCCFSLLFITYLCYSTPLYSQWNFITNCFYQSPEAAIGQGTCIICCGERLE